MKLSMALTAVGLFAVLSFLSAPAYSVTPLEVARSFVMNNPLSEVLEYLNEAYKQAPRDSQAAQEVSDRDARAEPSLVLENVLMHPDFKSEHLPEVLKIAEAAIARRKSDLGDRSEAFKDFVVHSIASNIKADSRSREIAERLCYELTERFEGRFSNWKILNEKEKNAEAFLLGLSAVTSAEAKYHAQVFFFTQAATVAELALFNSGLNLSAGGRLESAPLKFRRKFLRDHQSIARAVIALESINFLNKHPFDKPNLNPQSAKEIARRFNLALSLGNQNLVEDVISKLEADIGLAFDTSVSDSGLSDVILDQKFLDGLKEAGRRFSQYESRLISLRQKRTYLITNLGEIRLNRIRKEFSASVQRSHSEQELISMKMCHDTFKSAGGK